MVIYFFRIPELPDPESRMMAVLEWYLTSFHAGRQVRQCFFVVFLD